VNGAEASHLQITHGDSRKPRRRQVTHGLTGRPVGTHRNDTTQHVDSVRVERHPEEGVEQEQLADHVDQVETLDNQVDDDEIVAAVSAARTTDGVR